MWAPTHSRGGQNERVEEWRERRGKGRREEKKIFKETMVKTY